ncbi:MAG TPA: GNAT family N-acetyltransferase [Chloroflexia bacterium]|nr:GNAT family N-acetyltransferase [Chloroflexia bacterium]
MVRVILRDVVEDDLPVFFEYQQDPLANHMAAFTSKNPADREAFMAHWARILSDDTVTTKTILLADQVVGSVGSYVQSGETEVTYWIGREHWGKGIATDALSQLLEQVKVRPLHARAAKDNLSSIRVLEKCGFAITGYDRGFANARGEEIEEVIMELQD